MDKYQHAVDGLKNSSLLVIEKDHKGKKVEIRETDPESGVVIHRIAVCRKAHLPAWFDGYIYGCGLSTNQEPSGDDPVSRLRSIKLNLMKAKEAGFSIVSEVVKVHRQLVHAKPVATICDMEELKAWLNGCEYSNKKYSTTNNTTTA